MEESVTVNNLCYKDILTNINMTIKKNSITILSGANKSGKTTLLKVLGSLLSNNNSVKYNTFTKEETIRKVRVISRINFKSNNTIKEELKHLDRKIISILELTDILDEKIDTLDTFNLKKVNLAKELSDDLELILLDDPCLYLSNKEKEEFLTILNKLKSKYTIVFTTTNLEETLYCDYLYILDHGNIVLDGNPISILQEERTLTRIGLKIPFMMDLSLKLKFYEVFDNVTLDMEEMVNTLLWK